MSSATSLIPMLLLLVATGCPAGGESTHNFTITDFSNTNLTLTGGANVTSSGLLELTHEEQTESVQAFYNRPFLSTKFADFSFSSTFVFAMVSSHPSTCGHGMTFALSPSATAHHAHANHYLGLFNSNASLSRHIFAVELDTVKNPEVGDINNNHVGIDVNNLTSLLSATPVSYDDDGRPTNLTLASGEPMQVWVDYDGRKKLIRVSISSPSLSRPKASLLELGLDLRRVLTPRTFVGFTSATGGATASHYVLGWSFSLNGEATPLDPKRLPRLPSPREVGNKKKNKKMSPAFAVILSLLVTVISVLCAVGLLIKLRRRQRKFEEIVEEWEMEYGAHRIPYRKLHKATDGFKKENIIGVGGVGVVYKGVLQKKLRSKEVAVKRIGNDSGQWLREFVAEIASMGRLRHRNLVQLLGYSRRPGEMFLVYDYMANGSLDRFLFDPSSSSPSRPTLKWGQRLEIIKGVAAGLLYLHEGSEKVVVHRDIKASNVLLDNRLNPKLCDFGLARLYDRGANPRTTLVVGTVGYLAPELVKTGKASTKTDVYAFGNFILEVVCGRRPAERLETGDVLDNMLVDWATECWRRGALLDVVDPSIGRDYVAADVEEVLLLALLCTSPNPANRPTTRRVVELLDGTATLPPMSPTSPSGDLSTLEEAKVGVGVPAW